MSNKKVNSKLTKKQVKKIRKKYKKGKVTRKELAEKYEMNIATIGKILRGVSYKSVTKGKNITKPKIERKILKLFNKGKKPIKIAKELGVSLSTVSKYTSHLKTKKITTEDIIKIKQLKEEGHSFVQIAEVYQVSDTTIGRLLKKESKKENLILN